MLLVPLMLVPVLLVLVLVLPMLLLLLVLLHASERQHHLLPLPHHLPPRP